MKLDVLLIQNWEIKQTKIGKLKVKKKKEK